MKYKDHEGNEFDSLTDMCKHYGIGIQTFRMRMRYKWTLERALTQPLRYFKKCKDHLGNEFKSELEMCRYWHITLSTFRSRMSGNWSLKDALTMPVLGVGASIPARDHLGKDYPSMSAMFRAWGVPPDTAFARLKSGRSIEETLTMKGRVRDYKGRWFTSHKAMCEYHKVNYETYLDRKEKNWTIKERLTGVRENRMEHIKCKDHEGNVFSSLKDMCEHHNVSYALFRYRIKHGASLETALTEPEGYECKDHLGNKFPNKTEMCKFWKISLRTFNSRIKLRWLLEAALTEPVDNRRKK